MVGRVITHDHWLWTNRPPKRLLLLRLLPLCRKVWLLPPSHKLAQLGTKGGLSNLERFKAHDPPALKGGGDSMVVGHCFRLIGKDTGVAVAIIAQASTVAATITRTSATVG